MQLVDYLSQILVFRRLKIYYYFICVHSSIGLSPYTVRIKVLSRFERNCIRIQNISNDIYAVPFINPYKILKFSFVYFKSKSEIFSDFKRLLFDSRKIEKGGRKS